MIDQSKPDIQFDVDLVQRLIDAQFPEYANLEIKPVAMSGWDNRTFHLGDHLSVRLPSAKHYVEQVEKEHAWLPRLAPGLPIPISSPVARGEPSDDLPWAWSIYEWLPGNTAWGEPNLDLNQLALDLADFLLALQDINADGAPEYVERISVRGGPVQQLDKATQKGIADLPESFNRAALAHIWNAALESKWQGPNLWAHGDVAPGNLLVDQGRLCAVIDFGCLVAGDPACDMVIAWTFLDAEARELFRQRLAVDDGTWARGRGWALWKAAIVHAQHIQSSAIETAVAPRVLFELVADL